VQLAVDTRLGRTVAVKTLLDAHPQARARFAREIRITARLQHPAIVGILEAGTWPGGEPFYVMKLVTGASLDKVVAGRATLIGRVEDVQPWSAEVPHLYNATVVSGGETVTVRIGSWAGDHATVEHVVWSERDRCHYFYLEQRDLEQGTRKLARGYRADELAEGLGDTIA